MDELRRFDEVPPDGFDLGAHVAHRYGPHVAVGVADGFCVWDSLVTGQPYLLRSLDLLDGDGVKVGHVGVSKAGRVKIRPSCSCKPTAEEAIASWEAAQAEAARQRRSVAAPADQELDEACAPSDYELPGMWEYADFTGGRDEVRGPDWSPGKDTGGAR